MYSISFLSPLPWLGTSLFLLSPLHSPLRCFRLPLGPAERANGCEGAAIESLFSVGHDFFVGCGTFVFCHLEVADLLFSMARICCA